MGRVAIMDRGYTAQVAPRAAQPLPAARPEDFGAGVVDAVGQGAAMLHTEKRQDAAIERKIERNQAWTQFQVDFASVREDMSAAALEGRESDDPGHGARMADAYRQREEALLSGISDRQLQNRARATLAEWGAQFRSRESTWETGRQQELSVERFSDQRDAAANRVRRLDTPEDYGAELKVQMDAIAGMDVPDKVKRALVEETEQQLGLSYVQGQIDRDPALAKAMLESGAFDDLLKPQQVDQLLGATGVEIRRAEAKAEHERRVEIADFKQDVRQWEALEGQGRGDYSQLPALVQRARELGLDTIVTQLEGHAANEGFARMHEGAPPQVLEQRLAELKRKRNPNEVERMEIKWIEGHIEGITSRYRDDPVGFMALEGGTGAPPPVDFSDPGSVQARAAWAQSMSDAYQRPVPMLSRAEIDQLRVNYEDGRRGEESVLALLGRLPPAQAMQVARELDPQDKSLPIMATLPANYRGIIRRGREAMRADRQMLVKATREDPDLEEGIEAYNRQFHRALQGVPPDQRDAIFSTARYLAAGQMDKHGGGLSRDLWWTSLNMAMGMRKQNGRQLGGFGTWGGQWFLLPAGVSPQGFGNAVRRQVERSEDPPVNPDGSRASISRARPIAVGGGWYEWRVGNRPLRTKSGAAYRVRVSPR